MDNPILKKLLAEGPDSMNLSALGIPVRTELLTKAGDIFFKEGKHEWSARSYELAGNNERLTQASQDHQRMYNFRLAALYLLPTKDAEQLALLGHACIEHNDRESALRIFESIGDTAMVAFVKENK